MTSKQSLSINRCGINFSIESVCNDIFRLCVDANTTRVLHFSRIEIKDYCSIRSTN